ncbi:hypothetical protein OUZ56_017774 [Daphnia magna]|uniref:Uncharacterized protein n=1 Tax=Daphnia magna TaxID=35525 RepID=A0ABR0ATP6_9CRUS|nr:hypothetical protein OUZ56_017774 [Daphnia magna]
MGFCMENVSSFNPHCFKGSLMICFAYDISRANAWKPILDIRKENIASSPTFQWIVSGSGDNMV